MPTERPRRRQRRRSERQQGTLARQRPDNETEETHPGYVGTGRRRPAWRVGGDLACRAAEVKPGGALDLEITGFLRAEAFGGEQDDLHLDSSQSRSLDFRNDTEVHVIARGKSEESGLEYGATIEFEADTNSTLNTDETWIFLRGGWGELRFGDEDGVVDNSVVGGQTIAAGTGGIDGSDAVIMAAPVVFLTNSNDATKIRYYTPSFGGFSLGVSLHADPAGLQQRLQQRPGLCHQEWRPGRDRRRHGCQEHRRGCRRSMTAISAVSA